MFKRSQTRKVQIGNLSLGGSNHVFIQSMTNIKTSKSNEVIQQINKLVAAGCEIIRVSVLDEDDVKALSSIKKAISIPLVADIHFDYKLAIKSIQNGADKVRVNPGNLGDLTNFEKVVKTAKKYHCAIRIGINSGSFDEKVLQKYANNLPLAMIETAKKYIKCAEKLKFYQLVIAFKSSDVLTTIKTNLLAAQQIDYPLHLGITEAGDLTTSLVRSSAGIGILLHKSLGNTLRISISGDPIEEIYAAKELLATFNLSHNNPRLISCPTCGRTQIDLLQIIKPVKEFLKTVNQNLTIAIMGCVVNGPGEAKHADLGIAGGKDEVVLFKQGKIVAKYPASDAAQILISEIKKML